MTNTDVIPRSLNGRLANGWERDSGKLFHAVPLVIGIALCGAKPGRRSAGWSENTIENDVVTCPRCLKKMKKERK